MAGLSTHGFYTGVVLPTDFEEHVTLLLAQSEWVLVLKHLQAGVRLVSCREDGARLKFLAEQVPAEAWGAQDWAQTLGLIGYRAGEVGLMRRALALGAAGSPELLGLRAYVALLDGQYDQAQELAFQAEPGDVMALRTWPRAVFGLRGAWREAFQAALTQATGRDRALIRLDFALVLSLASDDLEARSAYAQAVTDFRGDVWGRVSALGNLGMTCLRLGDLLAAERALLEGLRLSGRGGAEAHRCLLWRGLGGVWREYGEFGRALHAFEQAGGLTVNRREELPLTVRGEAFLLAVLGRPDEALATVMGGLVDLEVGETEAHRLRLDLALLRLRLSDLAGARQALQGASVFSRDDRALLAVAEAEVLRRRGQPGEAAARLTQEAQNVPLIREWSWLFPELFALVGIHLHRPTWAVQVRADGPVEVRTHGQALDLRATGDGAALLVLLLLNGTQMSRERLLETMYPHQSAQARTRSLNTAMQHLRKAFFWPGVVSSDGQVVQLSREIHWLPLQLPPPERSDLFCEGRYDEWVLHWRLQHESLNFSEYADSLHA